MICYIQYTVLYNIYIYGVPKWFMAVVTEGITIVIGVYKPT